jgi:hypothetical protein
VSREMRERAQAGERLTGGPERQRQADWWAARGDYPSGPNSWK